MNHRENRKFSGREPTAEGREPVRRSLLAAGEPDMKLMKMVLGFEYVSETFVGAPYYKFLPKGLMIWGAPDGSIVDKCLLGAVHEVLASHVGIPVEFFNRWQSYEQIAKAIEEGLEPPGWCSWDSLVPGQQIRIQIKSALGSVGIFLGPGDGVRVAMWGIGYV